MAFKMKGWSGYQKSPLKTDTTLVQGARDSVEDKTSGQLRKAKAISDSISGVTDVAKSALTKRTDPPNGKPKDDDSVKMTPEQKAEHRAKVLEYNKNKAKPMNEIQKKKIKEQLSKMDPNDPEAKLLQDMLNLKKNR